jgi:hypothetical protein
MNEGVTTADLITLLAAAVLLVQAKEAETNVRGM